MIAWLPLAPLAVALAVTGYNLATWRRGRPDGCQPGPVSVCVPARDEAGTIRECVEAALDSAHRVDEIVVYDDGSTDGTDRILARIDDDRLRVLRGSGLPPGWIGKPHACARLADAARGDLLVFVDADTTLTEDGVGRIASLVADLDADVVTAVPRQRTDSFFEHLLLPLLHLTYTSWLPLSLVHASPDPRFLAANGQVLAIRRQALARIGGFEAIRAEVVDDMALCRRAKEAGLRVVFADGDRIASCRMYGSLREIWDGFSKNLYEGLGERPERLALVVALYAVAFVVPYGALVAGLLGAPGVLLPGVVGVGANLVLRIALAVRYGHRALSVLLHPVAVLLLLGIAVNSWRWSRRGRVVWSGRAYPARGARHG